MEKKADWHLIPQVIVDEFYTYNYDSLGYVEPEDYQSMINAYNENYSSLIEDNSLEADYYWATFVTDIKSLIIRQCYDIVNSIMDDFYTFFFYLYCPSTKQIEEIAIQEQVIRVPRIVNTSTYAIE